MLQLTTKLEAVNILLTSIGEDPVSMLGSGIDDAQTAEAVLDEVSRRVQVQGWEWNTEQNYPLKRQVDNRVRLAPNILSVDFNNQRYTQRGQLVYDKMNFKYEHDSDLVADVIIGLEFEELPEVARTYITYSAGRVFQGRRVGSQILHEFTKADEEMFWRILHDKEEANADRSLFDNAELRMMLDNSTSTPFRNTPAGSIIGDI